MSVGPQALFHPRLAWRRRKSIWFAAMCCVMAFFGVLFLATLLARIGYEGWKRLSWSFLSNQPSQLDPDMCGLNSGLWGTIWIVSLCALVAVPMGVAAAIYLQEYAPRSRFRRIVELNIANLAGVPSIVYGILGLAVFVRWSSFGHSILSAALTLSLLILPIIIIASREAFAAVPNTIREAAYAVGATRWQMIWSHVLPSALPGIMTGIILSISRAIGEAAPLIVVGAAAFVRYAPEHLRDDFTALPILIFNWSEDADVAYHELAASGIVVLLAVLVPANAIAIAVRALHQRKRI